ncbi:MAG: class I SAM-dependent methyltransferase [Spongiibacteraceae bacterium]
MLNMKLKLFVLGCSVLFATTAFGHPAFSEKDWTQALSGAHRSVENQARDRYRRPRQTLAFFGLGKCDTVVELWPGGGGWYSEVLAPLLKDCGQLITAQFDVNSSIAFYAKSVVKFKQKLAASPEIYDRVKVTTLQPPELLAIAAEASADKVFTFRNVHNWLKSDTADQVFSAAYAALKPGGVFGVVEHRADRDASIDEMIVSGYVSEQKVIELAKAAGFALASRSQLNTNLADKHQHPKGVWTLPPSLRLGEQDRDKYMAIGESDRMTLMFVKPQ